MRAVPEVEPAGPTRARSTEPLALAACPRRPVTRDWVNREVVGAANCPGRRLFVEALTDALARRGLGVPVSEVTLPPA
jgi:hypothetical protein